MIVKKITKPNPETGEMEVTFSLTEAQVHLLMEFAINMLVGKGLVSFDEEEASNALNNKQMEIDFQGDRGVAN